MKNPLDIFAYVTSGNARFSLTGKRNSYSYRVTRAKDGYGKRPIYFVALLRPDTSFSYFANLKSFGKADPAAWQFEIGRKSKLSPADPAVIAFEWFWRNLVKAQALNPHKLDEVAFQPAPAAKPAASFDDPLDDVLPLT